MYPECKVDKSGFQSHFVCLWHLRSKRFPFETALAPLNFSIYKLQYKVDRTWGHFVSFREFKCIHFLHMLVLKCIFVGSSCAVYCEKCRIPLQCPKCSRQSILVQWLRVRSTFVRRRACLEHFVHCRRILHWAIW